MPEPIPNGSPITLAIARISPVADDGIRHAAAHLAGRFRSLGEEGHIHRAHSLDHQIDKNGEQRNQYQNGRQDGECRRSLIGEAAPEAELRRRAMAQG